MSQATAEKRDLSDYSPRDRILAAALKLFVDQGYFNTNVPDLSRESQCSVGSIYHNFKSKEEVASSLYDEGLKAFRNALNTSINPEDNAEALIKSVVKSFLEFCEVNTQLAKYMWLSRHNEFLSGVIKQPTQVGFDRLGRSLTKALKKAIQERQIRRVNANIIWSVLFGVPLAYVRDWLDGYNPHSPSQVADEIAETCWKALT